jgi:hypothetical protein
LYPPAVFVSFLVCFGLSRVPLAATPAVPPFVLTITCPTNITVQCASAVPAAATDSKSFIAQGGTISDGCPTPLLLVSSTDTTNSQICPNRFTITRTYTVTDLCRNTETCNQTITVNDTAAPAVTCPTNVTVQCPSSVPPAATNSTGFIAQGGTISENCGDGVTVSSADATNIQTCPNRFVITRTYTVTDTCGNPAICDQTIRVNDTTAPAISCPTNLTVQCASAVPAPAADSASFVAQGGTISENCGGQVTVTSTDATNSQNCPNRFIITRSYLVIDNCNNVSTCNQTITVNDTTPPAITCPPNVTVQTPPAPATDSASFIAQGGTISENCSGHVTVSSTDSPGNQSITRTYRVTDLCGNSSTCSQLIVLQSITYSQDFSSGPGSEAGWFHYNPAVDGGQTPTWTFPQDGSGGFAYRMTGPPMNCNGLFNRGGSYRTEQYADFFEAVDVLNFETNSFENFAVVGARITTPGALQTGGYFVLQSLGSPRVRQQIMGAMEFSGEVNATFLDLYSGGAALIATFGPSRQVRIAVFATNDVFTAELYDRTDLLEPIARIRFRDEFNAQNHVRGGNLLGWLNLDFNALCDLTFDNYYASGNPAAPVEGQIT